MVTLLDPMWSERASLSLNKQMRKEDLPHPRETWTGEATPWVFPLQLSIVPYLWFEQKKEKYRKREV